jgi:hypothetical protein
MINCNSQWRILDLTDTVLRNRYLSVKNDSRKINDDNETSKEIMIIIEYMS